MVDPTGTNGGFGVFGTAGGDLSGTFPNPTVARVNGTALATVAFSGSAANLSGTLAGAAMVALTGDLSGTNGTTTVTVVSLGGVAPGPMATAVLGQIPGVATSSAANAGNIGEFTSISLAVASAIALSTGAGTAVLALPLSAGDWDVWGQTVIHPGATITVITSMAAAINTTNSSTMPGITSGYQALLGLGAGLTGAAGDSALPVGPCRISLAAAGTAYMIGQFGFATSTASVYGVMQARRRR